jgi:hypothetical protein
MFHNMSLDLNHPDEKSLKASQLLDQIVAGWTGKLGKDPLLNTSGNRDKTY